MCGYVSSCESKQRLVFGAAVIVALICGILRRTLLDQAVRKCELDQDPELNFLSAPTFEQQHSIQPYAGPLGALVCRDFELAVICSRQPHASHFAILSLTRNFGLAAIALRDASDSFS